MSFCEHCEGQRFDRARVLRALREERRNVKRGSGADRALHVAIKVIRSLEIPHVEFEDEPSDMRVH